MTSLKRAWEREAGDWLTFSQAPDVFAWLFNLPAFLDEVVPPPGTRTLDIGCGEGRVARELIERGHSVTGIDASPTLVDAARNGEPPIDAHVADAAQLPFEDASFDLAISFMVLQSVDEPHEAIREAARVLTPGGRLAVAIVHPMNSVEQAPGYFDEIAFPYAHERDGVAMTFHDTHRPLSTYFEGFESAGLVTEKLREPIPTPELLQARPEAERWTRKPCFLHVLARKPATTP